MKSILLALASLVLFLCACSASIDHGTIYRKWKQPAHVQTTTSFIRAGKVLIPVTNHRNIPDKWYVEIHQIDPEGYDLWRTVEVTEEEFDKVSKGQEYKVKE